MAVRTISTKLAVQGEGSYRASMTSINSVLKTLRSSLKLVESEFAGQANSMKALEARSKALQDIQAQLQVKIKELKAAFANCQSAVEKYEQRYTELKKEIEANNKALEELKNTSGDTSKEQAELTEKNAELNKELEQCEARLDAAKRGCNNWQQQLNNAQVELNKLDSEIEQNTKYLDEAKLSADGCAQSIDEWGNKIETSKNRADDLKDALAAAGLIAALKEVAEGFKECADSSIEFESAMAGVAKTTDLSEVELQGMASEIKRLSTEIPVTTTELAGIVESAGQLGIAKEDLLSFATVMANLGVSTNLTAEAAATMLARFANVTGMAPANYERLGSVIVDLGNHFATTESEIVTMGQRLAAAGKLAGMTEPEIMALAAAMSSVGIEAEAGGTAMTQTMTAIEKAVSSGSDNLTKFAEISGMSAEQFSETWKNDPIVAIQAFIEGLGELDAKGESATLMLDEMGLSGVRQGNMLKSLATASGLLSSAVGTANKAWEQNTALMKEASTRYETTESKVTMAKNSFNNLKIAIGDHFTPAIGKAADGINKANTAMATFVEKDKVVIPILTGVVAGFGALAAAVAGYTAAVKVASAVSTAYNALMATAAGPYVLIAAAVVGVAAAVISMAEACESATPSVKELTENSRALGDSFGEADSTFQKTTAAVEGTAAQAAIYAQRLKELEAAGLDTDAAHKEYELTVEKLNAILPELNLTIDEQTGLINGGTEALLRNIDAWKQAALEQAALDKYETELKAWAEAQLEVATNQAKLNSLGRDHKDLLERRAAVAQRLTEISQEIDAVNADVTLTYAEQAEKIRALNEETQALAEEHGALLNEIAANEKEQAVYTEAVEAGTEVLGGYEEQVEAAQEAVESLRTTQEESSEGMSAAEQAAASVKDRLAELATSYSEACDKAKESFDSQFSLWEKLDSVVATSTDDMIAAQQSQAEYWENYSGNLENLLSRNIDGIDEFALNFTDGSAQSAAALAGLANASDEEIQRIIDAMHRTDEAREALSGIVGDLQVDLQGQLETITSDFEQMVTDINGACTDADFSALVEAVATAFEDVGVQFQQVGADAGAGLAQGITLSTGEAATASTAAGQAVIDAMRDVLQCHSPSAVTIEIGQNTDEGLAQGITQNAGQVTDSAQKLSTDLSNKMREAGKESVTSFMNEFNQLQNQATAAMNNVRSAVNGTASAMPGEMTSIGAQMVSGMISGIYSRAGALYSAISSVVSNAIARARTAAAVHSPSKKTEEIFENVGEGMVVGIEKKKERVADATQDVVSNALSVDTSNMKLIATSIRQSIPDMSALLRQDKSEVPIASTTVKYGDTHITIEKMEVREEADIYRIADELNDLVYLEKRKRGNA